MFSFRTPPLVSKQRDLLLTLQSVQIPRWQILPQMGQGFQLKSSVPVCVDAWVKTFVAKKARAVITDVAKLDVVSHGLIHFQLLNFCQNARMAFLVVTRPLLFFLKFWHRWMTPSSRLCVGTELEEGM